MSESRTGHRRVKLYELNEAGNWDDRGTGYVVISEPNESQKSLMILSEDSNTVLLDSEIQYDDIYQRQGETLILWCDQVDNVDLALSFQESDGCLEVWREIRTFQGRTESDDDSDEDERLLPVPTLSNLEEIERFLFTFPSTHREELCRFILSEDYITLLVTVFRHCEEVGFKEGLASLYGIIRSMIFLAHIPLLENLLAEEYVFDVMGMLENDPERPGGPANYREYLKSGVVFHEIVPFRDSEILSKIHQNFRINFLRDVVLARSIDDATSNVLSSMAFFNLKEIIMYIQADPYWLKEVFSMLHDKSTPRQKWISLIGLIQETVNLGKSVQNLRVDLFSSLFDLGLFLAISKGIFDREVKVRQMCVDVLYTCILNEPMIVRRFILSQKPSFECMNSVVLACINETDPGLSSLLLDAIRLLVDIDSMLLAEKDEFLNMFYGHFISKLLCVFDLNLNINETLKSPLRSQVCDFLSTCILQHSFRSRNFIISNEVLSSALSFASLSDKTYALASFRLLRAWIGLKEHTCSRHVMKHNLFDKVVEIFEKNGPRYNLINSAVIEMFDFIRRENLRVLIQYVVERFRPKFESVKYVSTFQDLFWKYDASNDSAHSFSPPPSSAMPDYSLLEDTAVRGMIQIKSLPGDDEDEVYLNSMDDDDLNQNEIHFDSDLVDASRSMSSSGIDVSPELSMFDISEQDADSDHGLNHFLDDSVLDGSTHGDVYGEVTQPETLESSESSLCHEESAPSDACDVSGIVDFFFRKSSNEDENLDRDDEDVVMFGGSPSKTSLSDVRRRRHGNMRFVSVASSSENSFPHSLPVTDAHYIHSGVLGKRNRSGDDSVEDIESEGTAGLMDFAQSFREDCEDCNGHAESSTFVEESAPLEGLISLPTSDEESNVRDKRRKLDDDSSSKLFVHETSMLES